MSQSIWDAIHVLRGEHLSAGMRLSRILLEKLPERLEEIQEGEGHGSRLTTRRAHGLSR